MIILTLRTDKPEAEIGLFDDDKKLKYYSWIADRNLAETILHKIDDLLASADRNIEDVEGIVVFAGPGSFTGLRIGVTVANTVAYSLGVPIIGANGPDWQGDGIRSLLSQVNRPGFVVPEYGSPANITHPRK